MHCLDHWGANCCLVGPMWVWPFMGCVEQYLHIHKHMLMSIKNETKHSCNYINVLEATLKSFNGAQFSNCCTFSTLPPVDVYAGLRSWHGEGIRSPAKPGQGGPGHLKTLLFFLWRCAVLQFCLPSAYVLACRCALSVWRWWSRRWTRLIAGSGSCPPVVTPSAWPVSASGAAPRPSATRSSSESDDQAFCLSTRVSGYVNITIEKYNSYFSPTIFKSHLFVDFSLQYKCNIQTPINYKR